MTLAVAVSLWLPEIKPEDQQADPDQTCELVVGGTSKRPTSIVDDAVV